MTRKMMGACFLIVVLLLAVLLNWPQNPERFAHDLISTNDDLRNVALRKLPGLNDSKKSAVIAPLIAALSDPDERTRRFALYALRRLNSDDARLAATYLNSLKDPRADVRREAGIALSESGPQAIPLLIAALEQADPLAAPEARRLLIAMGPTAVPAALEALRSPRANTRRNLAEVLGLMNPKPLEATKPLLALLKDPDGSVRVQAAVALNNIDPTENQTIAVHIAALKQKSPAAGVENSVMALERLGPSAAAAVPALKELLKKSTDSLTQPNALRPLCARALNKINPRREQLFDLLWDLKQNDAVLRYRAVYAISERPQVDAGAQSDLVRALDDSDPYVAGRALVALTKIGFNQSDRYKRRLIEKSVAVVGRVGETRLEGLTDAAAAALSKMDPALVSATLMPLINGQDELSKQTAAHLLEKINLPPPAPSSEDDEDAAAHKEVPEPQAP